MKILVIDDIRDNLTALKAIIKEAFPEATVYLALSGKDGIKLASTVEPDVIMLDIIMPEMDGFEVCRRLKQNKQLNHIPVVFLTALRTSAANRIKALEAGGDGFLSKPVNREELIAEVKAMSKIKAAAERKKIEKEQLEKMVAERTIELEKEIKLRVNTEMKLRESEEKYRTLIDDVLDTSDVGVFILDAQFRVVWINEATENYFGIKRKDVIGKDKKNLVLEHIKFQFEDPEGFDRKVLAAYENNTYIETFICHMLPGKNREERWLEHWSQPIRSGLFKGGRIEHYTDITRLKKAEDQLKKSRERYKIISELTSDYVFENEVLADGTIGKIWMAGSFEAITGYSPDEFTKMGGWRKILHPEDVPVDDQARKKLFNNEKAEIEVRIYNKNGRVLWVKVSTLPVWDNKNDRLQKIIGSVKDITNEKRQHQILEIQYNIAKSMVTSPTLGHLFTTVKKELNKIIYSKNLFIAFYNSDTGTLTTKFGEDEKESVKEYPAVRTLSGKVIKAAKPLIFKKTDIKKLADRKEIDLVGKRCEVWLGAPLIIKNKTLGVIVVQNYDDPTVYDGNAVEIMGIIANQISLYIEQKRTEEFNLKLSKATEQSPTIVIITTIDGTIEYVNPKFTEVTGYTFDEVKNKNPRILKSGEHDDSFYKELWNTISAGKEWKGEFHNKKKNGEFYWENALIFPIFNEAGEIIYYASVKEDITEKKQMLDELVAAKEKAQESDRLKTAFLQNMSHELRTPLNGILGFSQLLEDEDTNIQQIREYASYIESSGNRLLGLINNILDVSKIEAGVVTIRKKTFSLNRLVDELYKYFNIRFEKKGIELELKKGLPDDKSLIVMDESRLNQIIMNLMDNAFKFTSSGKVMMAYEIKENSELLFQVKDTGRGIAPEYQSKIFERFYQVDTSFSRGFEGAGLGLPIAKGLVENLGGRMWLESEEGKGSVFYFTIPYINQEKEKSTAMGNSLNQNKNKNRQKTILIVEDDETSYYFLKILLKKRNYEILYANCGENAVDICHSRPDIDLVLMDIKMTGMSGLEATKKIKAMRPKLPVIAQTAYAFRTDKETILNAGCDDYITKPIRKEELLKKMDNFLKG